MESLTRYMAGGIIGFLFGALFMIWLVSQLIDTRPQTAHRVSVDNDRHVYWCDEYTPPK